MVKKIVYISLLLGITLSLTSCGGKTDTDIVLKDSGAKQDTSRAARMAPEETKAILSDSGFTLQWASIQGLSQHIRSTSGTTNIRQYINSLTGSDMNSTLQRSYLQSFVWDYEKANAERDKLCSYNSAVCPQDQFTLNLPTIVDKKTWEPVKNTRVYINTKRVGTVSPKVALYNDMVHRVRVEKEGYLDSYGMLNALPGGHSVLEAGAKLKPAELHISVPVDTPITQKVTNFTYTVPANAFVDGAGKPVSGKVDLYFFSMDTGDQDLSIFQLNAFAKDGTLLWDNMITFGMPLVTAYQNGVPLDIKIPIDGTGTILNQTSEMDFQNVPKNVWLWEKELLKYKIPPFWSLNRKTGTWTESQMMILDTKGNYRFQIIR